MIKVDISNVWGEIALPDLLAMEKEVAAAHATLADGTGAESFGGYYDNTAIYTKLASMLKVR